MPTTLEFAKSIEQNLHDHKKLGFDLPKACLYGVDTDGLIVKASEHGDIYDMLDTSDVADLLTVYSHIAVATTGWASPVTDDDDDDTPPSKHKDRRRVRLVVIADKDEMVSALRFSDEADRVITDTGMATGSLADAIMVAVNKQPSSTPWDFLVGDDND